MRCMHINIRQATFIVISFIVNNISVTQMAENLDLLNNDENKLNQSDDDTGNSVNAVPIDLTAFCSSDAECKDLNVPCIECEFNPSCIYGDAISAMCTVRPTVECKGPKEFERELICRYCYQTESWEHSCELKGGCNSIASPKGHYAANCTVKDDILCLGHRTFNKNIMCNWTGGYRWSTALILSITLGGFGADRFYLGHWQEGIGKLFSFGGLGVWTLIDVILISLHYLGPADGSLYI